MEAYRSGHNEAVLKTVWVQAHRGSNPFASAISIAEHFAAMAQQVEHVLGKDEVTGSSPVSSSTRKCALYGALFLYEKA